MLKSIITEYGIGWVINRLLYSAKMKIMSKFPITELLFEKNVEIKRVDIFDLNIDCIQGFLLKLPVEKQNGIIEIADKAVQGIIIGFSSVELNYGCPINWHYSPITKHECSRSVKWYNIPDFDANRGDVKAIWEASRFTHFFYLARAYLITREKKYYQAFSVQLNEWLRDNPYPYGVNYKCGQECTLRMINALIAYAIFNPIASEMDTNNIFRLVQGCYQKVLANFFYAHKCIKNNHTLSEITGQIIGAWCCDDRQRLVTAYKLLDQEISSQFRPDGGYVQNAFNYQRFALQIMECVLKISEKTGLSVSAKSKSLIKNSALLLYHCQDEGGDVPNYGHNDGALLFPVTICGYRDFTPVINTVYALLTGHRLYAIGYYDEEILWFGDGIHLRREQLKKKSMAFNDAGIYILRHDGGFLMICLQDYKTRPAHMDGLHIDLWHKGKNLLCDSGTYSYARKMGAELIKSAAHNTVIVQNLEQMNIYKSFLIFDWTNRSDVQFAEERFSGTMNSKNGYEHTRKIIKTKQGYEITDIVRGNGDFCHVLFHTPYNPRVELNGVSLFDKDEKLCSIKFISPEKVEVQSAYRSLYYSKLEEVRCVAVKCSLKDICTINYEIILE